MYKYYSKQKFDQVKSNIKNKPMVWCYRYRPDKEIVEIYHGKIAWAHDFIPFDSYDNPINYHVAVTHVEGEIYRNTLWLSERNDDHAKALFFEYYDEKTDKIQKEFYEAIVEWEKCHEVMNQDGYTEELFPYSGAPSILR